MTLSHLTPTIRSSAALGLVVVTGFVHGEWIGRWHASPRLVAMTSSLRSIPMTIGDWKAVETKLPAKESAMAGAVGYVSRRYMNSALGTSVNVLLLCGLPGNISTHTPDVCYPGSGYVLELPDPFDRAYGPDSRVANFRTALATRDGTNPLSLRIFWSWNSSKGWSAPDDPRWSFGSEPALCKLYVIRETSGATIPPSEDPSNRFLDVFLPELDRCVFAAIQ